MKKLLAIALFFMGFAAGYAQDSNRPQYEITVTHGGRPLGTILLELFADTAPQHVRNFDSLVRAGAYDSTAFHRVIPGFMIQGGDPNSKNKAREMWGMGDPSQKTVPAEFSNTLKHTRGILSAARTPDPNSATSQFFIMVADAPQLDGKYSIYGQVIKGIEVADQIVNAPRDRRDNPLEKVQMVIKPYTPAPVLKGDEKRTVRENSEKKTEREKEKKKTKAKTKKAKSKKK